MRLHLLGEIAYKSLCRKLYIVACAIGDISQVSNERLVMFFLYLA